MEHCTGDFCHKIFVTDHYNISTSPFDEWHISVLGEHSRASSDAAKAHGRRFESIEAMMKVEVALEAKLSRPEVIAVVLYTGPMVRRLECNPFSRSLGPGSPISEFACRC